MPLFLYECDTCKKVFEVLVFGNQKAVCPACGSEDVHRKYDGIRIGGKTPSGNSCNGQCAGCSGCHHGN